MTVSNPASVSRVLLTVGVNSEPRGLFQCLAGAYAATPLADYRIHFPVTRPVTEIKADPELVIEPGGIGKFTISLIPDGTGACGFWEAKVSVFAKFDDGTVLSSGTETVSASDVRSLEERTPEVSEVLAGLNNKLPANQAIAVMMIPRSGMDALAAREIVEKRLFDADPEVRKAAASVAVSMNFVDLMPTVVQVFLKDAKGDEQALTLSRVCEKIKDESCIDPLLKVIVEYGGIYVDSTLVHLQKFAVADRACEFAGALLQNPKRDQSGPLYLHAIRYLAYVLFAYHDVPCLPIVKRMIDTASLQDDKFVLRQIMRRLSEFVTGTVGPDGTYNTGGELQASRLRRDPFFIGLIPTIEPYRLDKDKEVRERAARFLDAFTQ
jgi:hypothetical protein